MANLMSDGSELLPKRLGIAEAALEAAVNYAKERVSIWKANCSTARNWL